MLPLSRSVAFFLYKLWSKVDPMCLVALSTVKIQNAEKSYKDRKFESKRRTRILESYNDMVT